jgi:hypothetical protein
MRRRQRPFFAQAAQRYVVRDARRLAALEEAAQKPDGRR